MGDAKILGAGMGVLVALGSGALAAGPASTQNVIRTPRVESVRLYVLDCGLLKRGEPRNYRLKTEEVGGVTDFFDGCYLVVHPNGTLLWDTGIVPDALVTGSGVEIPGNNFAYKTLKSQLAQAGYRPGDITYLAMSHSHADHVANANDYAGSTWLVQRAERDVMFAERRQADGGGRGSAAAANYSALKLSKTVLLDGDRDVFGDGTVLIKSTPGHTPGHQSLFVKLAKRGPVLLSGDLYHYRAERTLNKIPLMDNQDQTRASREAVERFLLTVGGELWIQHDLEASRKQKKAPDYYD
jgi:glyoxylase-like metal-dependent hydrolase (beta-lactamase superfamily II)